MQRSRNIIGPQLRRLRFAAGLSQPALAARFQRIGWDIERDTIAKIEGQTRWVSDAELVMIARCFGISIAELLPLSPATEKRARALLAT
jgi:transcriptional regulator with XRE-family HTH domain